MARILALPIFYYIMIFLLFVLYIMFTFMVPDTDNKTFERGGLLHKKNDVIEYVPNKGG